ncbi:MAG TPA: hypothetical protein VMB49_04855 [Acidobacteriaceae bacterium]|nr:hypothetical protein [Acidobacteriaceae bacterium]
MNSRLRRAAFRLVVIFSSFAFTTNVLADAVNVTARVKVTRSRGAGRSSHSSGDVVIWLTPSHGAENPQPAHTPQNYTLIQKNKQFIPHILVVPTGSSVDFPNLDPFYHNVFSLFNGKRFDLGLYEAHTHRAVRFDRDGVSYIFCNIHPEMGAVVIALSTPYFAVSKPDGSLTISNVPPGSYRLNVWAENVAVEKLNALSRMVDISSSNSDLGAFELQASGDIMTHHENKFGESYTPEPKDKY